MKSLLVKGVNCILLILVVGLCFSACGKKSPTDSGAAYFYNSLNKDTELSETQTEENEDEELYLIVDIDTMKETMRVYRYYDGLEYQLHYGMNTDFCNKYGDHTSQVNFRLGDAVYISETDLQGKVTKVTKADRVWNYDDISKFSVDENGEYIQIGDDKYMLEKDTYIFSGEDQVEATSLTKDDVFSMVGLGSKVLSVYITTGHGTLELSNTELFEGSFLQLNTDIFAEITKDMSLDLPEGDYTLAVANNGWGSTTEITIERGQTTSVDLDEIKGDGPKLADILFQVDVEGARVLIDGEDIDYVRPVQLTYGAHNLTVIAEGYNTWSRTLYVNSPEATVVISLKDEENKSSTDSGENESAGEESGTGDEPSPENHQADSEGSSTSNSNASGTNDTSSNSTESGTSELSDYLSTLSELLSVMY